MAANLREQSVNEYFEPIKLIREFLKNPELKSQMHNR